MGLNYAYYEPPGAEILHNNPLFVSSHDFSSVSVRGTEEIWGPPGLIGVGATAGGGALSDWIARRFALCAGFDGTGFHYS